MKNQVKKKSRRDFLVEATGALVVAAVDFDKCKAATSYIGVSNESNLESPGFETLLGYIERYAQRLVSFHWQVLCPYFHQIRRSAAFTFDRYFEFYQFKKRVLESKISEIEECVQKIDDASSCSKALILTAIYLYDCVYHENSRLFSYRWRRRNYGEIYSEMTTISETDVPRFIPPLYLPVYRSYYPYRFPVYGPQWQLYRSVALIGSNFPKHEIDESVWERWASLFERFRNANEEAFPDISIRYEDFWEPIELDERFAYIDPPFLLIDQRQWLKIPNEVLERNIDVRVIQDNVKNWLWNEWLASIDRLLERVQEILDLKLTAIMWATDDTKLADVFLRKADSYLKDGSTTDQEKYDLIAAAREYWASIQSYNGEPGHDNSSNTPEHDVLGIFGSRLKDIAIWLGSLESH